MIQLFEKGAYLLNGKELIKEDAECPKVLASKLGKEVDQEAEHNLSARRP